MVYIYIHYVFRCDHGYAPAAFMLEDEKSCQEINGSPPLSVVMLTVGGDPTVCSAVNNCPHANFDLKPDEHSGL